MQYAEDRTNYQGMRYDLIAFDELTHFTWEEYSYMFSRNRPGGPGTRVYMRAATNPGGIGHGWVKERFVTAAPPMTPIVEEAVIRQEGAERHIKRSRIFVPASVYDNKALLKNDPNYLANLAILPDAERRALLYGDWDSFGGQVFREWKNDPARYEDRRFTHVIAPFRVPSYWRIFRGFDFGYAKPFAVGWFAADPEGTIYHIREYYGTSGEPNVGARLNPAEIAANIARIEREDENLRGRQISGVADPSIFDESHGESIAALMSRYPNNIYFTAGDNARIAGKMQLHYRFAFDEEGKPMFQVFHTCRHFIRTVPALIYDERNVEDVDTNGEDHIYDMVRYILMERPISPRQNVLRLPPKDDPLELYHNRQDKYQFYRV